MYFKENSIFCFTKTLQLEKDFDYLKKNGNFAKLMRLKNWFIFVNKGEIVIILTCVVVAAAVVVIERYRDVY